MRKIAVACLIALFLAITPNAANASPWAEKKTYLGKTSGKLKYGLKNSLFGWMQMFKEAKETKYNTEWEGFCTGIGRSVIYTASGLIQLVTFPLPVDFPDVGTGLYLPPRDPRKNFAPYSKG